ncbi:hypothetical protein M501DRAFT_998972 [Patellaria atrata CBS 101060]|uniref:Uncharacterized protein n=1 Tax=Patellaria atrata CBS 101060 TaxID=1346257 RepID=A0A9P4S4A3_9PEZI|nr:hypothetical protein M501DRAFT_998972 [Patellaria atrata CBS 101060]
MTQDSTSGTDIHNYMAQEEVKYWICCKCRNPIATCTGTCCPFCFHPRPCANCIESPPPKI